MRSSVEAWSDSVGERSWLQMVAGSTCALIAARPSFQRDRCDGKRSTAATWSGAAPPRPWKLTRSWSRSITTLTKPARALDDVD